MSNIDQTISLARTENKIISTQTTDVAVMKPGDVIIDEITMRSYNGFTMNLKGLFRNFVIYEDMFSNFMSGSITIIDSLNIVKNFPIVGGEVITVSFRTPGYGQTPRRHVFRTFKISLLTDTAQDTTQIVKVEFASHSAIKNMQTKVSKSYSGMPVSQMVKNIYEEYLAKDMQEQNGSLNSLMDTAINTAVLKGNMDNMISINRDGAGNKTENNTSNIVQVKNLMETFDKRSYVIPYTTPFEAINWLCSRARAAADTTLCDYVFFENAEGHHFVPISILKQQSPRCVYTKIPKGFRNDEGQRQFEGEMRNILSVRIDNTVDRLREQADGMMASSMIVHDMTTKTWNSFQYSYDSSFQNEGRHLEKNPLLPNSKLDYTTAVEACNFVCPKSTYTVSGIVSNHEPEETELLRRSLMTQIQAINLTVECYGDSTLKAGDVIEYNPISKEATKMLDSFEDDYFKGKYLVTAIRHLITDREYYMTMTISRDSYAEPLANKKQEKLKV